jgi:hypothetical protein
MPYGADIFELRRRSTTYVDKIFKCAKPAEPRTRTESGQMHCCRFCQALRLY